MDLQHLYERTEISKRRLRYCLDHDLIPGLNIEIADGEVGRPRKFHEDVGFGIVCAARLLDVGLSHDLIRHFLGGLIGIRNVSRGVEKSVLSEVILRRWDALAHLGDGVNIRIQVPEMDFDTGWRIPGNPAKIDQDYTPIVTVTLDVGQIIKQIV